MSVMLTLLFNRFYDSNLPAISLVPFDKAEETLLLQKTDKGLEIAAMPFHDHDIDCFQQSRLDEIGENLIFRPFAIDLEKNTTLFMFLQKRRQDYVSDFNLNLLN